MVITATSSVAFAASVVAVVTSAVFVATILRYRNNPTTRPVIGVAVTLFVGAFLHLAVVDLVPVREALGIQWGPTDLIGGFWILLAFDLPAVVSGFWFLFALQYTGRDRKTSPIAYVAVGTLLVLLVAPTLALAVLGSVTSIPTSSLNALLGVTLILSESLALIGVFLVIATTIRYKAFPAEQTALLTAAVTPILVLPFVATTLRYPVATPIAVTSSGVLFTAAVHRYRIFETLPVASVVSRDRVIDEMSEGVVTIDDTNRIQDLNPTAETLLGVERSAAVRTPVDDTIPEFPSVEVMTESDQVDVHLESGRVLAVTADTVTDHRDRELGYLLVLRDVTEKRQQEHRLGVLTQLLAGAIQDEMGDVTEIVDEIAADDLPTEEGADHIHETATDIATLVSRVRALERALADQSGGEPMTADATDVLSTLRASTDLDMTTPSSDIPLPIAGNPELLTATLQTLATNARRGNKTPELAVDTRYDSVTVKIAPFDPNRQDSLGACSLEIGRLVAEHTDWCIRLADEEEIPAVVVSLPTVSEGSTKFQQQIEHA